jgi:predicted esterase
MRTSLLIGVALTLLLMGFGAGVYLYRPQSEPPPAPQGTEVDAGIEAWCADGLTAIAGGGCFAPPLEPVKPVTLLLYLHGRYSPKTLAEEHERQRRVARLGTSKGYAVLAMRGVQGECAQAELADTWCWPSTPRNAGHGAAFVERFEPAMREARARVGEGATVLLGFSNGGYFATMVATRALGRFDAIVIAHAGPVPPTHPVGSTPPLLLITADDDASDPEMRELDAELTREGWRHEIVGREGGHALPDWDVGMALTFFERVMKERLPLTPPLQPPRSRPRRESDAGEDWDAGEVSGASDDSPRTVEAPVETPYDPDDEAD